MGGGLSHPVSSKVLYRKGSEHYRVGAATMHGWRDTMEDEHVILPVMPKHKNCGFFGIFDGHSGSHCSEYISKHLPTNVDEIDDLTNEEELREVVIKTDEKFLANEETKDKDDGSAGIFTICIYDSQSKTYTLMNGNVGDSRTVLAKRVDDLKKYEAIACTHDHKPTDEKERKRIENAGGCVQLSRVDGQLALSRAFGDRQLKQPASADPKERKVTSNPDFIKNTATKSDFLFLACDGIYESDVFTREGVIDFIEKKLEETDDIATICGMVIDESLKRGSRDNMSCIIIQFVDGSAYQSEKKEYIPGPWHDGGEIDQKFQEAYIKDALDAGCSSIEEAHELRRKLEEKRAQH